MLPWHRGNGPKARNEPTLWRGTRELPGGLFQVPLNDKGGTGVAHSKQNICVFFVPERLGGAGWWCFYFFFDLEKIVSIVGWLNQPSWKICANQIGSFPQIGMKINTYFSAKSISNAGHRISIQTPIVTNCLGLWKTSLKANQAKKIPKEQLPGMTWAVFPQQLGMGTFTELLKIPMCQTS